MAKSAEKLFEEIKEQIENPLTIRSMSQVSPYSPNPDCEACFTIYTSHGDRSIHTSSVRKANKVKALIGAWIAESKK